MKDPHTRESRGFGFVKMVTSDEADAAKEALQGEVYEGRTLSIEKARRARPRTPTPGKYFGPPKRGESSQIGEEIGLRSSANLNHRGSPSRPRWTWWWLWWPWRRPLRRESTVIPHIDALYADTSEQDRGYGRRDDYRGGGYRDRYDDRGSSYGRRDDYGPPRDRYGGGDRYGGDRRGGGSYGSERPPRAPPADGAGSYGADSGAPRDAPPPRSYDDRRRYD